MDASTLNAIRTLAYITVLAHIDPKAKKPEQPKNYPLPGQREQAPQEPKPGSFRGVASQMFAVIRENKKKRRAAEWQQEVPEAEK